MSSEPHSPSVADVEHQLEGAREHRRLWRMIAAATLLLGVAVLALGYGQLRTRSDIGDQPPGPTGPQGPPGPAGSTSLTVVTVPATGPRGATATTTRPKAATTTTAGSPTTAPTTTSPPPSSTTQPPSTTTTTTLCPVAIAGRCLP